jgi:WD40 repeat protein
VALAVPSRGVTVFDGTTLQEVHRAAAVRGVGLVAGAGGIFAATLEPEAAAGPSDAPAVTLLERDGTPSRVRLGGTPVDHYAQQELSFSPHGRWLAAVLLDREGATPPVTAVWDLRAPARPAALVQLGDQSHSPVVTDDGRTLYGVGGGRLRVLDLASGRTRHLLGADALGVPDVGDHLVLAPDGRTLALDAGPDIALLDAGRLRVRALLGGTGATHDLAFSRDGRRLASTGQKVVAWDLTPSEPRELLRHEDPAGGWLGFSPDAATLYTVEPGGLLLAWDLTGDRGFLPARPAPALAREDPVVIRFSPDRRRVAYVWSSPPAVQVRDAASGRLGPLLHLSLRQRRWIDLAWSPDSQRFNVTTGDGTVGIWDAVTGRVLAAHTLALPEAGPARRVAAGSQEGASIATWSVDGRYLLVGSTTGRLHVLDGHTLEPVREPVQVTTGTEAGASTPVQGLEPCPDLHTVVTYSERTRTVDYRSGAVAPAPGYGGERGTVFYAPRGGRALVATSSGEVGLVDAVRHRWLVQPAAVPPFPGFEAAWSPDGTRVATSNDGRVGWWDASGGFQGSTKVQDAQALAFADDGNLLYVAGTDGRLHRWDLDPARWLRAACAVAGRDLSASEWRSYLPGRPAQSICG